MRALVRDNFTCVYCGEHRLRHLQVHHKVERQYGGTHDLENLETVCVTCHSKIHPHMLFEKPCKEHVREPEADDARTFDLPPKEL
jgi:5-methylcytosine-specific restriction endonuclease McrA